MSDSSGGVIVIVLAAVAFSSVSLESWWYSSWSCSVRYGIPQERVNAQSRPTDCEWSHAPLGVKSCHYEVNEMGYNAAGELVHGTHAPKYAVNRQNLPIVSYDAGKTWTWASKPDLKVSNIVVVWQKVEEP
jgi:hypothetical protein